MRSWLALTVIVRRVAGCTPFIPERLDFGTSALAANGDIPPHYAGLNNYRRTVFDMLIARPGEWIDFDPKELGYSSGHCSAIRSDLADLRNNYNLDIRTAGVGRPSLCRWRYVPR